MNQREPTSAPLNGAGPAWPWLALFLFPLLAVTRAWGKPSSQHAAVVPLKPYLTVLGAPPLRFEEPAPPPDLTTRPPATAPPYPHRDHAESAAPEDLHHVEAPGESLVAAPESTAASTSYSAPQDEPVLPSSPASTRTPAPILPDDTRPQVRPEDFLPYFQIPATSGGDPGVIVPVPRSAPAPAPIPPSSATYTQTPR